ncbi:hypothetical protein VK792_01535 [Mesobacterium sp. TK19101]|uniref:Uncharacterized protein n=1 Tax=Mesobacterium hydrothermale TaxID=3111907 RepID=A0ABU6HBX5_9RHOB|nr:hypothetical protein [Mesobacterium sp. TK19101]MEC3859954.1 hypothetical protein [Mesobacterium sp. TK19101]
MKTNFALSLSFEGIALLRRAQRDWYVMGETALDVPDLNAALKRLREMADAASTEGGKVKLIIPNEQIRYLSLPDEGLNGDALIARIRQALDGATPYAVKDLVFDYSVAGGKVMIAAVARETLTEAEMFASGHHFEPVSHAAAAAPGDFAGEVYFGPASGWSGPSPEREAEALVIIDVPPPEPETAPAEKPAQKETPPPVEQAAPVPPPKPAPPAAPSATVADIAPDAVPDAAPDPAPVAFTSIRAQRDAAGSAPRLDGVARDAPAVKAAPTLAAPRRGDDDDMPPPAFKSKPRLSFTAEAKSGSGELSAPSIPEPASAARRPLGFFSRRKSPKAEPAAPAVAAARTPEVLDDVPDMPAVHELVPPAPAPATSAATPKDSPKRALTTALLARKTQATPEPAATGAAAAALDPAEAERQRMTVFGAREQARVGGKPRFLGLMLTAILLLFLAGVAAWASVFLDDGLARFFPSKSDEPVVTELPAGAVGTLAPAQADATPPQDEDEAMVELAALETPVDTPLLPLPAPALPEVLLTPEQAEATYAATGIWQRAPIAPDLPGIDPVDNVYSASIDTAVDVQDAVALPDAKSMLRDAALAPQVNPAPPGVRFTLDARGVVVATPEGAMNPDGIMIYAGKPPVVPPLRPAEAALLNESPELLAERARLAAARPRPRPEGLVESAERAQLGGFSRAELGRVRPKARTVTQKEVDEQDTTATAQAVKVSTKPLQRPRNFAAIVQEARKSAPAEAEVTQAAAVTPRSVAPSIPSSASVAKQATVKNAIRLNDINLIGVYGKPSSRRALVRLANGRYKKVKVGDRLDGGEVAAIGEDQLRYVKRGKNVTIKMP